MRANRSRVRRALLVAGGIFGFLALCGLLALGLGIILLATGRIGWVDYGPTVPPEALATHRAWQEMSIGEKVRSNPDWWRLTLAATETAVRESQTGDSESSVDGQIGSNVYFDGFRDPCISTRVPSDPCKVGRQIQFPGTVPRSVAYPSAPPTLEELLFNSWGGYAFEDVPGDALLGAKHIVVRGEFAEDSLRCGGYPVINPNWSLDHASLGIGAPLEGEHVVVDFGIDHWMCFAIFNVHEYMIGQGGASLNLNLAAASIPYNSGLDFEATQDRATLDQYEAAVVDHFVGSEWVVWLGPSYTVAVQSWTAYSFWDIQRGDDGVIRVVSPVAEHYEQSGLGARDLERLMPSLVDFRRDIQAAQVSRVRRTSGRIGVGTDTPKLVTDAFKLSDYYEEVGANSNPIATPAPPPR